MTKILRMVPLLKYDKSGFTIIEILIAISIFGIGVMAIVGLQVRTMTFNNSSIRQREAYSWGMDRVERLISMNYSDANLDIGNHTTTDGVYTINWTVTGDVAAPNTTKKMVAMSVLWNGNGVTVANLNFIRVLNGL